MMGLFFSLIFVDKMWTKTKTEQKKDSQAKARESPKQVKNLCFSITY